MTALLCLLAIPVALLLRHGERLQREPEYRREWEQHCREEEARIAMRVFETFHRFLVLTGEIEP